MNYYTEDFWQSEMLNPSLYNTVINNIDNYKPYNLGRYLTQKENVKFTSNVLMTYSDSLYFFGKWYLQLWAESIGKNNKGKSFALYFATCL